MDRKLNEREIWALLAQLFTKLGPEKGCVSGVIPMTPKENIGPDWQFVFTCAAGQDANGKLVLIFGSREESDGTRTALVAPWPTEVPIDGIVMFDRRLAGCTKLDGSEKGSMTEQEMDAKRLRQKELYRVATKLIVAHIRSKSTPGAATKKLLAEATAFLQAQFEAFRGDK